jgi:hypothetical protein
MSRPDRPPTITAEELRELARQAPTVSLMTAGRALGYGHTATYEAVKRGDFPCRVISLGTRKMRVPVVELLRVLGLDQGEAS